MLGAVKRLEKCVLEEEQAERVARIVDVYTQRRAATSHGPDTVLMAEVIDVEAENSILLGEEDFTPLKFFSRSEDNDLGDEVDYDSDSQKGISVGSPCSLQLAFSSPLSLDRDLSACMAFLRNSPVKKSIESSLNLAGAGELKEACEKEREGTSHAQDQAAQVRSDSVVPFSVAPLLPSTGKEGNEAHPPIRKVRGLTPPAPEAEGENSPQSEAECDPELELLLLKTVRQDGNSEKKSRV
jgi:hypothetical protein